jgi:hypothetical protein
LIGQILHHDRLVVLLLVQLALLVHAVNLGISLLVLAEVGLHVLEKLALHDEQVGDLDGLHPDSETLALSLHFFLDSIADFVTRLQDGVDGSLGDSGTHDSTHLSDQVLIGFGRHILLQIFAETLVGLEGTAVFTEDTPDEHARELDVLHFFGNDISCEGHFVHTAGEGCNLVEQSFPGADTGSNLDGFSFAKDEAPLVWWADNSQPIDLSVNGLKCADSYNQSN